jgi:hypothetical protein
MGLSCFEIGSVEDQDGYRNDSRDERCKRLQKLNAGSIKSPGKLFPGHPSL